MSRSHVLFVAVALVAGACTHAQVRPDVTSQTTVTNPNAGPRITPVEPVATASSTGDVDEAGRAQLNQALAELRNVSVFFAFDSSVLAPEGEQKLANVGRILAAHPTLAVRIEGNCDERGTEAYNLSLGQSRADEATRYLARMGAQPNQLNAVSYGDERPKAQGHTEEAWRQNRRDDVVVAN